MTPKRRYLDHKGRATKLRGIPFLLTYEEWLKIWVDSGHFHEIGRGKGQYCMSRINDSGPYAVGNVFIQLTTDNSKEYHNRKKSYLPTPNMTS